MSIRHLSAAIIVIAGIGTAQYASAQSLSPAAPAHTFGSVQTQQAAPLNVPQLSHVPSLFSESALASATKFPIPTAPKHIPISSQLANRLAPHNSTCYTVRSSRFSKDDLESDAPKPSSTSTCTSTVALLRKDAVIPAAR